jgi:formate hydrogenlyase subunit 6/NADH:ubiquinone oxidoreductase subunit I
MKTIADLELVGFFRQLASDYDIRVPVLLPDGGRAFGSTDGALALGGGALPTKPTAVFFPQDDTLFAQGSGGEQLAPERSRPLFIAGFTSLDLRCLKFMDRFFADGFRDDVYFRTRESAVIAAVSGYCGPDGALLPLANGDCDLELIALRGQWLVRVYSDKGEAIALLIPGEASAEAVAEVGSLAAVANPEEEVIKAASALLLADAVPDSFWEEIAVNCIQCSGCNLVCPTCTCFGVQDWRYADRLERSRMWDSCQLDGFMREAGGHNPLGTEALRTRRRIHHKLAADMTKWGELGCFVCGRCDATCPTGIGIVAVARQMVAQYGSSRAM